MNATLEIGTLPGNRVSVSVVSDANTKTGLALTTIQAVTFASELLKTAAAASTTAPVAKTGDWPVAHPGSISFGRTKAGKHCMILHFGDAAVGVELEANIIQQLGKALATLGATGNLN